MNQIQGMLNRFQTQQKPYTQGQSKSRSPLQKNGYGPSPSTNKLFQRATQSPNTPEFPPQEMQKEKTHVMPERINGRFISKSGQSTDKVKKPEKKWSDSYRIVSLDFPQLIDQRTQTKKKWMLRFVYVDDTTQKQHSKLMRFGRRGFDDFIDHHDVTKKERYLSQLRNAMNPLKPNFWNQTLLNSSDSLEDNYMTILRSLIQKH